jgi:hypothetical protein
VGPSRRRSRADHGTFAVEYPPHDSSLDSSLPSPKGVSGGGIWLPGLDEKALWSPKKARLIGIPRAWWRGYREEVALHIEHWLELVANDIPELKNEIAMIHDGTR